ncbi:MAG: hypothetical protein WBQ94_12155 [Terracidiphilus sp.]
MKRDPRDEAVDQMDAAMVEFAGAQPDKREIGCSPHVHPTENWICLRLLHHHGKRIVIAFLVFDGLKLVKKMDPIWYEDGFHWDVFNAPDEPEIVELATG